VPCHQHWVLVPHQEQLSLISVREGQEAVALILELVLHAHLLQLFQVALRNESLLEQRLPVLLVSLTKAVLAYHAKFAVEIFDGVLQDFLLLLCQSLFKVGALAV